MVASSKKKTRMCHNCGIIKLDRFRRKMCSACYAFWRRNDGQMRPQHLYIDNDNLFCRNKFCKRSLAGQTRKDRGYCSTCATYWNKHKKLRFSQFYRRKIYSPCKICGDDYDVLHKKEGRCRACHTFLISYGKERQPQHYKKYLDRREYCKNPNCKIRLTVWEIQGKAGWCDPCLSYWNRWEEMRPRKLCLNQIPHDKCDCGAEAKHQVEINILKAERKREYEDETFDEILHLCDQCYELEMIDDLST